MTGTELMALEHIDRNGNLVWASISWHEAGRLFDTLKRRGMIERNMWSGRWVPTDEGRRELSGRSI